LSALILTSIVAACALLIGVLLLVHIFRANNPDSQNALENKAFALDTNVGNESVPLYNSTHLDTPYIKEYSMPNGTWPNGILVDKSGIVWTVGTKSHSLLSFDPNQGRVIASYPIPQGSQKNATRSNSVQNGVSMAWAVVQDKNGSIWFSHADSPNPLWRFDPSTKKFESIHMVSAAPYQMRIDQNTGNIWFTTFTDNKLGVIQKIEKNQSSGNRNNEPSSQYKVSEFNLGNESFPSGLYLKGDSVWVTQSLNNKLAQFKVIAGANGKVANVVKKLEIPSPTSYNDQILFDSPYDLVVLGNNLWVTEHDANFITAYNMSSKNATKFAVSSNPHQYVTLPFWLREADGEGGLWFNEHYGNRIAFFNTTALTLIEYEIPTRDPNLGYISNALNFAVDPTNNKNVWFSEYNHDKIGLLKSSVSIPFNIHSSVNKVVLSKIIADKREQQKNATTTIVNFEISKNSDNNKSSSEVSPLSSNVNNHEIVFFKTSSSMTHFGLLNSTANFSVNYIDLTKMKNRTAQVQLIIQNDYKVPPGTYTLGISATDGRVTKSIFPELIVR
jgi:streptogramin lyase